MNPSFLMAVEVLTVAVCAAGSYMAGGRKAFMYTTGAVSAMGMIYITGKMMGYC